LRARPGGGEVPQEFVKYDPQSPSFHKRQNRQRGGPPSFPVIVITCFLIVGAVQVAYKYGGQPDGTLSTDAPAILSEKASGNKVIQELLKGVPAENRLALEKQLTGLSPDVLAVVIEKYKRKVQNAKKKKKKVMAAPSRQKKNARRSSKNLLKKRKKHMTPAQKQLQRKLLGRKDKQQVKRQHLKLVSKVGVSSLRERLLKKRTEPEEVEENLNADEEGAKTEESEPVKAERSNPKAKTLDDILTSKPRSVGEAMRIFYYKHDKTKVKLVKDYIQTYSTAELVQMLEKRYGEAPEFLKNELAEKDAGEVETEAESKPKKSKRHKPVSIDDILSSEPRTVEEALTIFYYKHDQTKVKLVHEYVLQHNTEELVQLLEKKYGEAPEFLKNELAKKGARKQEAGGKHNPPHPHPKVKTLTDILTSKPRSVAEALRIFYYKHDKQKVKQVPKYITKYSVTELVQLLKSKYGNQAPDLSEWE
jgi:hypothetical protein